MAQILIRDLDPNTVDRLKRRAASSGRSLQAEVRELLEREAQKPTAEEFRRRAEELAKRIGPQTTDCVDLIREDRER